MQILAVRWFARFARHERIIDAQLCDAIARAERGLIDADLGGGVIKQRLARPGKGRSGGYRVLIAYRTGERAVFLYGFAKNERDNIDAADLADLKRRTADLLAADEDTIEAAIADDQLKEVHCDQEEET